ncbi:MAG: hypothetical protein ABIH65_03815 [Nanoarchaeota archaeon]
MINEKEERKRILKGLEDEIRTLEKNKDKIPDYDNRVVELKKEISKLKEEIKKEM